MLAFYDKQLTESKGCFMRLIFIYGIKMNGIIKLEQYLLYQTFKVKTIIFHYMGPLRWLS